MSFSQNTLTITSEQLRTANLIFAEHEKLSKQLPLLEQEINNYKLIDSMRLKIDSLRIMTISDLTKTNQDLSNTVEKQHKKIKRRNWWLGGSGCVILCLLLML